LVGVTLFHIVDANQQIRTFLRSLEGGDPQGRRRKATGGWGNRDGDRR
jgi:hypothetical protein